MKISISFQAPTLNSKQTSKGPMSETIGKVENEGEWKSEPNIGIPLYQKRCCICCTIYNRKLSRWKKKHPISRSAILKGLVPANVLPQHDILCNKCWSELPIQIKLVESNDIDGLDFEEKVNKLGYKFKHYYLKDESPVEVAKTPAIKMLSARTNTTKNRRDLPSFVGISAKIIPEILQNPLCQRCKGHLAYESCANIGLNYSIYFQCANCGTKHRLNTISQTGIVTIGSNKMQIPKQACLEVFLSWFHGINWEQYSNSREIHVSEKVWRDLVRYYCSITERVVENYFRNKRTEILSGPFPLAVSMDGQWTARKNADCFVYDVIDCRTGDIIALILLSKTNGFEGSSKSMEGEAARLVRELFKAEGLVSRLTEICIDGDSSVNLVFREDPAFNHVNITRDTGHGVKNIKKFLLENSISGKILERFIKWIYCAIKKCRGMNLTNQEKTEEAKKRFGFANFHFTNQKCNVVDCICRYDPANFLFKQPEDQPQSSLLKLVGGRNKQWDTINIIASFLDAPSLRNFVSSSKQLFL